jgi:murein DD-endopeptidase MepM/ murein hydrolase activator NlpD
MILPVKGPFKITSPYGWRTLNGAKQFHDGIDWIGANTNVYAIAPGICAFDMDTYSEALRWTDQKHSAGNMVIIQHTINGFIFYVRYLHLIKNIISQKERIEEGQKIGEYADVGYSFGAHLHLDAYDNKWNKIDPTPLFRGLLT